MKGCATYVSWRNLSNPRHRDQFLAAAELISRNSGGAVTVKPDNASRKPTEAMKMGGLAIMQPRVQLQRVGTPEGLQLQKRGESSGLTPGDRNSPDTQNSAGVSRNLQIFYTNACSLGNKWDELICRTFGHEIIVVSETWMSSDLRLPDKLVDGFTIYRSERAVTERGGGVLILVRTQYSQKEGIKLSSHKVQCVSCTVDTGPHQTEIVAVYRAPDADKTEDNGLLAALREIVKVPRSIVIIGDFNAPSIHWEEEYAPARTFGSMLLEFMHEASLIQHVEGYTRLREGCRASLLDLVFTRYSSDIKQLTTGCPIGKSDHLTISMSLALQRGKPTMKYRRCFTSMNVDSLLDRACSLTWIPDHSELSIEGIWAKIKCNLSALTNEFAPLRAIRKKGQPPWWRSKLRRAWRRKHQAWAKLKAGGGHIRMLQYKRASRQMDRLHGGQKPSESDLETYDVPFMNNIEVTVVEVGELLGALDTSKSPGPDGIHPAIVKPIASVLAAPLQTLYQKSLNDGILPRDWMGAKVTPIYKGGCKEQAVNYRPVSLTSILLKTLERIIRNHVVAHVTENKMITIRQHGFVKRRSCQTNLICFLEEVTSRLDRGEEVEVCYLDFRKAFDSVNQRLLLLKLRNFRLSEQVLNWIAAFLHGRTFHVEVEGSISREAGVCSGVPQGSVLGPLLFVLFVNDLARQLYNPCFMFADDLKLVGDPRSRVTQEDLNKIRNWTNIWGLPLNASKCKQLTKWEHQGPTRTIHDGQSDIAVERVDCMRDLGVQVTSDFKPRTHCLHAARKANGALHQLKRAMQSRQPWVLVPLYKAFVRPHLEYCVQAWAPHLKQDKAILEAPQRRFTRWFSSLRSLSYQSRLEELGLFSMERRRRRGDLIEVFKILNGFSDVRGHHLLPLVGGDRLRGHNMKIVKRRYRLDVRGQFFTQRVVNDWNVLTEYIIEAHNVTEFKHRLDEHWECYFRTVLTQTLGDHSAILQIEDQTDRNYKLGSSGRSKELTCRAKKTGHTFAMLSRPDSDEYTGTRPVARISRILEVSERYQSSWKTKIIPKGRQIELKGREKGSTSGDVSD
ncbi:uncharacterized protein LOC134788783 [Penaeus indicus]|uniref:uncharacterized protein LOC134788783 n=1 Tax=Penaeus indicus TaxID=29960 RepID=UPI00300DB89D